MEGEEVQNKGCLCENVVKCCLSSSTPISLLSVLSLRSTKCKVSHSSITSSNNFPLILVNWFPLKLKASSGVPIFKILQIIWVETSDRLLREMSRVVRPFGLIVNAFIPFELLRLACQSSWAFLHTFAFSIELRRGATASLKAQAERLRISNCAHPCRPFPKSCKF